MSKKYENPPIVEAVCEFRFDPTSAWDPAVPGLIFEEIKSTFPKRKKLQLHEMMVTVDMRAGVKQQQQFVVRDRAQFLREDETVFVQVDENLLAVNHLKPYSKWSKFFPVIKKALEAYLKVANPKGIQRIGLRYINEITVPKTILELERYFNFRPYISQTLPQNLASFSVGTRFMFDDERNAANVQLVSKPNSERSTFMLDIDYFLSKPDISLEPRQAIYKWIDNAHRDLENIFEGALTEETKKLFN